ncbi:hypothetical protein [Streptomyces sp. NPDC001970]
MLGLSDRQSGEWGSTKPTPTRDEIRAAFPDGRRVDVIGPATIDITTDPTVFRSWPATLTRI